MHRPGDLGPDGEELGPRETAPGGHGLDHPGDDLPEVQCALPSLRCRDHPPLSHEADVPAKAEEGDSPPQGASGWLRRNIAVPMTRGNRRKIMVLDKSAGFLTRYATKTNVRAALRAGQEFRVGTPALAGRDR
jgi:hypothetical protein